MPANSYMSANIIQPVWKFLTYVKF